MARDNVVVAINNMRKSITGLTRGLTRTRTPSVAAAAEGAEQDRHSPTHPVKALTLSLIIPDYPHEPLIIPIVLYRYLSTHSLPRILTLPHIFTHI